jgi:hypothetical protein
MRHLRGSAPVFCKMYSPRKDDPPTSLPRTLTEDERQLVLDWAKTANSYSAFVSERRNDDPAIYRRIIVFRRDTNQHLYKIHTSSESPGWIMLSAARGDYIERFGTLRGALDYVEPVSLPKFATDRPIAKARPAAGRDLPRKGSKTGVALRILCWSCALAAMLVVSRWLSSHGDMADGSRSAEAIAEQVVQDSVSDPDSTQFRNVMAYRVGLDNERWVCGWFNAKATGGAYLGYRRFVVHVLLTDRSSSGEASTVRTHLLMSETEVPSLSYAWENYCR